MKQIKVKYLISAAILVIAAQMVFGAAFNEARSFASSLLIEKSDSAAKAITTSSTPTEATSPSPDVQTARQRRRGATRRRSLATRPDSLQTPLSDSILSSGKDSLGQAPTDSLAKPLSDTVKRDSTSKKDGFLEDIISGKNTDSLVYDIKNNVVYIYNEGDITYQDMNLKADFMRVNMETKEIYAYGKPDSVDGKLTKTHPVFTEGQSSYTMDTIRV